MQTPRPHFVSLATSLAFFVAALTPARGQTQAPGGVPSRAPGDPAIVPVVPPVSDGLLVSGIATVRFQSFEGGFYSLETDGDTHYDPSNLPADFQRDGLRVHFDGLLRTDLGSTHLYGQILELTTVTRLVPFAGFYLGIVRRETADGQHQDGSLGLTVREDGTVFGSLYVGALNLNQGSEFHLRGTVDQDGRGSFKVTEVDRSGSELIPPGPGPEKMPLLFFHDGRVVGGSLDRNWVSLTLRAQFVPPVSFPPPQPPAGGS